MGCTKVRYQTRRLARTALRDMMGRGKPCSGCHPYRCSECDFFHVGHMADGIRHGVVTRGEVYG